MKSPKPLPVSPDRTGRAPEVFVRFMSICIAGLALCALAGSAAAQDAKKPAEKDAKEAPKRSERAPIVGVGVKVTLKSGTVFKGVRQGPLYVRFEDGRYVECKAEDKGAGVRVHFPRSQNGSLLISMVLVEEVEELGGISSAEGRQIALALDEADERAVKERKAEREAKEKAAIEAEKARLIAEAEKPTEEETAALARAAELAEYAALLTRFPPGTWTLETPDEIARRRVVLGLAPSDEDMAFLKEFDAWKKAFEVWKQQQAAAEEAKKAAEAEPETSGSTPPTDGAGAKSQK